VNRDVLLSNRILLQFAQNGQFSSVTQEEAYHVALLNDQGLVEAKVECDASGRPIRATIGRLTAKGHDTLERALNTDNDVQPSEKNQQWYYQILVENKHTNEIARDKMVVTIATGGIGLLFGIASYLLTNHIPLPILPWIMTLLTWTLVLVVVMLSSHLGGKCIDEVINKLGDPTADVMHKRLPKEKLQDFLNILNCSFAIVGIGTFTWFLLKIA